MSKKDKIATTVLILIVLAIIGIARLVGEPKDVQPFSNTPHLSRY